MPRINYARADIAKAAKLHKEMDDAWLAAIERDPDSVNRRRWTVADFVNVCGLYRREAKSGRVVHFGTWGKTRIYLNINPSGNDPAYWLAIRAEDYYALRGAIPPLTDDNLELKKK